ncbi:AAA family ATPase [Sulfurimonas sp.]
MEILNNFIKTNSELVDMMKKCSYHYDENDLNLHHLEDDVWSHTKKSYQNTIQYNTSIYVKWAILLHDIGRVLTRRENTQEAYVSFGDFEGVSIFMSIDILNKTDLSEVEKVRILKIISYHYTIIDHIKYAKPSKGNLLRIFKYEEELLKDLSHYVRCDLLGRVIDESKAHLYNVNKMDDFITYTQGIQNKSKNIEDKKNTVTILVGPPCSKKSFWTDENKNDSIVINRDSCVEEIGRKYLKNSYNEAYNFMNDNENIKEEVDTLDEDRENYAKNSEDMDIIIDNPNLNIKNRKEWIDAFRETHIIKVIVFLSPLDELIKCNKDRGEKINKNVTKKVLLNKLKTFEFPLLNEGIDYIEYST